MTLDCPYCHRYHNRLSLCQWCPRTMVLQVHHMDRSCTFLESFRVYLYTQLLIFSSFCSELLLFVDYLMKL